MRNGAKAVALAAALTVAAGCAASKTAQAPGPAPASPKTDLAALDAALAAERDETKIPALLFQRGHACLETAERIRDRRGAATADVPPATEYSRFILCALTDFEAVVNRYPASPEAAESLFHMGVTYDYPNLSSFEIAVDYYRRTIEEYPGTEPARKAAVALEKIAAMQHRMQQGGHGGR